MQAQDPAPPYPYQAIELCYRNLSDTQTLAGTITIPDGNGPFPAVVLITGSGPQDRDSTIAGHRIFLVLADHLSRHGIAVLRVDDRGVGGSSGKTSEANTLEFIDDVLAGVEQLKKRSEINVKQIGLIGHSEGGLIAPAAAVDSSDIAFIVLMAGSAIPGDIILYNQIKKLTKESGWSNEITSAYLSLMKEAIRISKSTPEQNIRTQSLSAVFASAYKIVPAAKQMSEKDYIALNIELMASPWMHFFLKYDPRPTLKKITCPTLALIGDKDQQIVAKENLPEFKAALAVAPTQDYTIRSLVGLNHLFQTATTGSPSEYAQIIESLSPVLLDLVTEWVLERTT